MLEEGWWVVLASSYHLLIDRLSPARSTTIQCDLHLDQVEVSSTGDFKTSSLAPHVNTPIINDLIVRSYLHRAGDRRSTLIFCVDLSHVANVTQAFREAGIDARSVSSISAGKSRKETLEAFANGEFPVLVNCEVLTEGTDIPVVRCREATED
jgi:ATP-dependent helicase IRC3